jgi:hypothetical protein
MQFLSMFASSAVDRVFEPRSGQTKDYEIGTDGSIVISRFPINSCIYGESYTIVYYYTLDTWFQ